MSKLKQDTRPMGSPRSWAVTYGTHLAGQAAIDGADHAAITMENKWGAGRLRLLVPVELREKFDKQRFLFNAAIWHGDLAELQKQAQRMEAAWRVLDREAEAAGGAKLDSLVWEVAMADGTVVALVRCPEDVSIVTQGRQLVVYTLDEIAIMLGNYREVTKAKEVFPGATVEVIRRTIDDPLDGIRDGRTLEQTFDDDMPHFGH